MTETYRKVFQNEYGTAELTPVTDYMPISAINARIPAVQTSLMTLEQAEQLAVISDNVGIQTAVQLNGSAYVILHNGPSQGAVCRCDISWKSSETGQALLAALSQATQESRPTCAAHPMKRNSEPTNGWQLVNSNLVPT